MARTTKSATATATPAAATEPIKSVDAAAPAAAPVKKAPKASKKSVEVVAPVAVESAAPAAPVDETESAEVAPIVDATVAERLTDFAAKIQTASAALSALRAQFKVIEKVMLKELKAANKSSKRVKRAGNRQPSGFIRPTLISDELAEFLGKPSGTEIARTEVSKELNQYIRANSLQDKQNGRRIVPDAKLATLLRMTPEDVLTYFNLQRYMKPHFIKTTVVAAVAPVEV